MTATEQELELKFRTTAAGVRAAMSSELLAATAPDARSKTLKTIYFDTSDLALAKKKMTLRVRRIGRSAPIMTLKRKPTKSRGPFSRDEIEVRIRAETPQIDLFDSAIAGELADILQSRPLAPQFQTNVRRRIRLVEFGGSKIEAAFDQGFVQVGERRMRLNEVELELKSGDASDLYGLGVRLVDSLPLRIDVTSKAQAAFAFARSEPSAPVRSEPIRFPQSCAFDDAIAAILQNSLDHFVANWAAFREGRQPESVHQLRVALRRLRSALTMFKALAPCPAFESFGRQAKELGTEFGLARQCDVFKDLVDHGPKIRAQDMATFAALDLALATRTASAYDRAKASLESAKTSIFAIELQALIARRGWREALDAEAIRRIDQPGAEIAAQVLERLHKKVKRRGENLETLSETARHGLRVALKKLRYGAEFLRPYFCNERGARHFNRAAAELQEVLGALNDVADASGFLDAMGADATSRIAKPAGLVLGWYGRNAALAEKDLNKAWKAFRRSEAFWRQK